jgi:leader peptidase (prepilin peptidase)/N-methyltransferase
VSPESITDHLIGAACGYAFILLTAAAYRRLRGHEGLGRGDAKLLAAAGAWVGWEALPSVLTVGCVFALSAVAAAILVGRSVRSDDRIPLGTYLAGGLWLVWLYGPLEMR